MKYFTLSYDDGCTQDARMMDILEAYGMSSCMTFNINTGMFGADCSYICRDHFGRPDVTHIRFTEEDMKAGRYAGYDLAVHTLTHRSLLSLGDDEAVIREVAGDAENIAALQGKAPVGLAWPYGEPNTDDHIIDLVLKHTSLRFARGSTPTHHMNLPAQFMKWMPSVWDFEPCLPRLVEEFLRMPMPEGQDILLYVAGHSYEMDIYDTWDTFEDMIRRVSRGMKTDESIRPISNSAFYEMFKDQIPPLL